MMKKKMMNFEQFILEESCTQRNSAISTAVSKIKEEFGVEFELFLLPNNKDAGALEDMLEQIINPTFT